MYLPQELAVYIHWPFCKSKCPYCNFYKELAHNISQQELIIEYMDSLSRYYEITKERKVKSIFFGGGTPSLLQPKYVAQLINHIDKLWGIQPDAEISLEANPNTQHNAMFTDLKAAGINRLSLGVQALNDSDLRFLGRTHDLNTARKCITDVVKVFSNHSVDLIYARPQQQIKTWQKELEEILSYGLTHISLYQLTIEPGTVFARKNIQSLSDELAAEMYEFTHDYLSSSGYEHYEISNFSRPGYASKHNLTYWQGGDYIGIGKSAHGRIFYEGKHMATIYPFQHEFLTPSERAEELILLGLRLSCGLNKKTFKQICGLDLLHYLNQEKLLQLKELKLVDENSDNIFITNKGRLLTDKIIAELCI